jgi:AcrR family transcriptional regulator
LKTRDKILAAARTLFNEQGVSALSALDIATAMGISPGHLYYHFKGKPEIVAALMAEHEVEIATVLEAAMSDCKGRNATIETFWTHIHILVEEAFDARFFYREAGAMIGLHPDIPPLARRITTAERAALASMLAALSKSGVIAASPEIIDGLSRTMVTGIGFHALELELEGDSAPPRERVARAAAQLILPVAALAKRKPR